jgi:aldose 1-epimerase
VWKSEIDRVGGQDCVSFFLKSPDGEEGYPGNLDVRIRMFLSESGRLRIEYSADSDAPTPVNLTNHVYFNLAGEGSGLVTDHELSIAASRYLEVDDSQIPLSGPPRSVVGTKYDFRTPKSLEPYLGSDAPGSGFDHCFVLDALDVDSPASVLSHKASGRTMKTRTSMPGIQLYTANNLAAKIGKSGHIYSRHSAVCLETEYFPDSPNRPDFPDCVARPGKTWESWTEYEFSTCIK